MQNNFKSYSTNIIHKATQNQIQALNIEISDLTQHLLKNPKDYSSRRGLLKKVGRRKTLYRFIKSK